MDVKGKTVLITGAAGGLGSVMAGLLAQNGAKIFLLDMVEEKGKALEEAMRKNGYEVWFEKIDLTNEDDWRTAVDFSLSKTGKIDVLVNNAGINIRKPIEEMSIEEWNTMMNVNTGSVFLGCKYVIPQMRKQHDGVIINISSVCGLVGHKFTPEAYTASKGADHADKSGCLTLCKGWHQMQFSPS